MQERERIERKGRPVVESAVGRVFAELATVPVRLDKQPGGEYSQDMRLILLLMIVVPLMLYFVEVGSSILSNDTNIIAIL